MYFGVLPTFKGTTEIENSEFLTLDHIQLDSNFHWRNCCMHMTLSSKLVDFWLQT